MEDIYTRTALLLGEEGLFKLKNSKVAVFGVGGVGGFAVEALARSGVMHITIVDKDVVSISNINRQIIASMDTIGEPKVEVMKKRIHSINPDIEIDAKEIFFLPDKAEEFDFSSYDYVVDAVDNVTAKIELILRCQENKTPIISAMGAGNKLDPTKFEVSDIYQTSVCPLARVMRRELKKRGVRACKVVYSREEPKTSVRPPGSIAFVPSVAGLIIAGEVVKDLTGVR